MYMITDVYALPTRSLDVEVTTACYIFIQDFMVPFGQNEPIGIELLAAKLQ